MSIVFDRAVAYYDQTRGLPPEAERALATLIQEHTALHVGSRVLELGVGTGRIALPLVRANGYRYVGVDLSAAMMGALRGKAGELQLDLVRGDVTRLPFGAGTFDAVVAVHVFHLIGAPTEAMDEAARVLRRGGLLLSGFNDVVDPAPIPDLRRKLEELAGVFEQRRAWPLKGAEIKAALTERFGAPHEVSTPAWHTERTARQVVEQFQSRIWSITWNVPEAAMEHAVEQGRAWAIERFGSLDTPLVDQQQFTWEIYTQRG